MKKYDICDTVIVDYWDIFLYSGSHYVSNIHHSYNGSRGQKVEATTHPGRVSACRRPAGVAPHAECALTQPTQPEGQGRQTGGAMVARRREKGRGTVHSASCGGELAAAPMSQARRRAGGGRKTVSTIRPLPRQNLLIVSLT